MCLSGNVCIDLYISSRLHRCLNSARMYQSVVYLYFIHICLVHLVHLVHFYPSIEIYIYLVINLSICLSIHLFIYLFIYISILLSISTYQYIRVYILYIQLDLQLHLPLIYLIPVFPILYFDFSIYKCRSVSILSVY